MLNLTIFKLLLKSLSFGQTVILAFLFSVSVLLLIISFFKSVWFLRKERIINRNLFFALSVVSMLFFVIVLFAMLRQHLTSFLPLIFAWIVWGFLSGAAHNLFLKNRDQKRNGKDKQAKELLEEKEGYEEHLGI